MKTDIFDIKGKKAGEVELPEAVFGLPWNDALMHQVVVSMQANARTNVAHTKGRGDVRGGGKKPWRQKGTGRARHGSSRSPIWKGGGVTHGPINDKVFSREIPKKMRAKALFVALSQKMRDGELLFVDSFGFKSPKTAEAKKALVGLASVKGFEKLSGEKKKNLALITSTEASEAASKSFRNIGSVSFDKISNLNPVTVLKYKYLVIENPVEAVNAISKRASKSKLDKKADKKATK